MEFTNFGVYVALKKQIVVYVHIIVYLLTVMIIDAMCVNRWSLVLCFLKDLVSSIQPVKTKQSEFGTAILVVVPV